MEFLIALLVGIFIGYMSGVESVKVKMIPSDFQYAEETCKTNLGIDVLEYHGGVLTVKCKNKAEFRKETE